MLEVEGRTFKTFDKWLTDPSGEEERRPLCQSFLRHHLLLFRQESQGPLSGRESHEAIHTPRLLR